MVWLAVQHALHVHETHVLGVGDDALGEEGLDDAQSGLCDGVGGLVHLDDAADGVVGVLALGVIPGKRIIYERVK